MPNPRLLLFGSPGAGKSSLLGALAQAAHLQAPALKGELVDKSGNLAELHKNTYGEKLAPTETLESYNIRLAPADGHASSADATLLDCSGQEALEILKSPNAFESSQSLRRPILDADAVLLLVDVSLPGKQLVEQFQQFGQWLAKLHDARGRRTDVGDLPIYLVLTKCDKLAKTDDTFSKWLQKIEEAKRQINEKFREYLKDEGDGFGSLDVKLSATAIQRPPLADRPANAQEPFGVAELFRESLDAAADFLERRRTSQRRLQNVLVGLIGLIAILGLTLAFLAEWQPDTRAASLEERAYSVLPKKDAAPAARLHGTTKKLEEKEKTLADIEQDASFARLPTELQAAVKDYRREVADYAKQSEAMKTVVKFPFAAKSEADFVAQEKALNAFTYPAEWADTPLGRRVAQCKKEYERVRTELNKEEAWLKGQIDSTNKLFDDGTELQLKLRKKQKLEPKEVERWEASYRVQMQPRPPVLRSDNIPGVSALTYEFLDKFDSIKDARKKWDAVKVRLKRVAENIQDEMR
jgi:GTPase SAR1 family protein